MRVISTVGRGGFGADSRLLGSSAINRIAADGIAQN